jgi:putative membrane protein
MIQRPRLSWFRMLFVWHGSVLPAVLPQLLIVLVVSMIAAWSHGRFFGHQVPLNVAPFTLIGVALALFLGFRNNASYERFWEGRKLWGALLNETRSLTRQAFSLCGLCEGDTRLEEWTSLLAAYIHCLRHQLRGSDPTSDLKHLLPQQQVAEVLKAKYRPAMILLLLGKWISERKKEGQVGEMTATALDQTLSNLTEVLGGCERLASTPIPYPYSVMIHRTVYLYCFLLPFGLVSSIGEMTPLMSVFIAYTFIVFEQVAQEMSEPFGTQPNDLPLTTICGMIQETIFEMRGAEITQTSGLPQTYIVR